MSITIRSRARRWAVGAVAAVGALAGLGVTSPPAGADTPPANLVGLVDGNLLVRFSESDPGTFTGAAPITGLAPGEWVMGIDMRPGTGQITALAISNTAGPDTGRIYSINPISGVATPVGSATIPNFTDGARSSVDFNPTVDRYRIVNTADQNLRANPNNGALAMADTNLNPAGQQLASIAYDRNVPAAAPGNLTTLFAITAGGRVVRIGGVDGTPSPNLGAVTDVGGLGVTPDDNGIGFDVSAQGSAFASMRVGGVAGLYRVNMQTGAASLIGQLGNGLVGLTDITVLSTAVPAGASQLVPLPPSRLLDTRTGAKPDAGSTVTVQVKGQGGVPANDVSAVALNITATDATAPGFVTAFPSGVPQPTASVLNIDRPGQTIAAAVTVPVGPDGTVKIFTQRGTHLVVDVNAYYRAAATGAGRFTPLSPARVLDTRTGSKPDTGTTVDVQITGQGGVPATNVAAVALNVTITEATAPGFVTTFPQGTPRPLASSLNADAAGQTIANLVIVPVGPTGQVSLFTQAGTHLVADVTGWFSADPNALSTPRGLFVALNPNRVLDTRIGLGAASSLAAGDTITVPVAGQAGVPATGAGAVIATVTATNTEAAGFVTAFPAETPRPLASNLNPERADQTIANLVEIGLGNGAVSLFSLLGTDLVADVAGYYVS